MFAKVSEFLRLSARSALAGLALAAPGDKLSDKGKIDQTPAVTADFGDDASQYANDGECDDIRFSGRRLGEAAVRCRSRA